MQLLSTKPDNFVKFFSNFTMEPMTEIPSAVMAGVTDDGKKLPLIFVEMGVKINRWKNKSMLEESVAPREPMAMFPSHFSKMVPQPTLPISSNLSVTKNSSHSGQRRDGLLAVLTSTPWTSLWDPFLRAGLAAFSSVPALGSALLAAWDSISEDTTFVLKFSLDFPKLSSSKEATVKVFKTKVFKMKVFF